MKNGWTTVRLGDLVTVQSGSGFPKEYQGRVGEPIPFYKVSDMNIAGNELAMVHENNSITETVRRELGASIFPAGSVIFPKIGGAIATNKKRLTTKNSCVDNNVMGAVPKAGKIDSDFLFYFFVSHDLSEFANEAHLPSIKKTTVEEWVLRVPKSLPEQRRIVGILDEAFEGIATAKANAEKNLQNARALFESHLNAVFTQRGNGWVEKTLGDLCETTQGVQIPKSLHHKSLAENRRRYLYISDFEHDGNLKFVDDIHLKKRVTENDLIVVNTGATAGKIFRGIDGVLSNNLFKVTLNPGINGDFLYYFVTSLLFKEHQQKIVKGTANPHMGHENFKSTPVSIPSLEVQLETVAKLDALSEETQRLEYIYQRKLAALDELKKSLLHQAFSGEL